MKIYYYCQHVLGVGHLHRSLVLCRAMAKGHRVTLILGGPPLAIEPAAFRVLQLPGLQMNAQFQELAPCQPDRPLSEVKTVRRRVLLELVRREPPDVFVFELYPFGRKAFRFELEPLLEELHPRPSGGAPCLRICSVRDILVEKTEGREKFERYVTDTLNSRFDGVLIHADPKIVTLDETFDRFHEINIPIHYTGFVAKMQTTVGDGQQLRRKLDMAAGDRLIVASIGGGGVGGELLCAVADAHRLLDKRSHTQLHLFTGPYCPDKTYRTLLDRCDKQLRVTRFAEDFPSWLAAADLSISMAGYNTCMDTIKAGIPALLYPFKQNREQQLRASRLNRHAPVRLLQENDLNPQRLSQLMQLQLKKPKVQAGIDIGGADKTIRQLERWYKEMKEQ